MQDHQVILITGASEGIGRATADFLAKKGYTVFGTSRNPSKAKPLKGVTLLELDIRDNSSVQKCVKNLLQDAGRLDALICNAGIQLHGAAEETTLEEGKSLFETNFFGAVQIINEVLPHMRTRRSGRIVAISSTSGFRPQPFFAYYSASKHALEGFAESLRYEVMPFGIKVTILQLGGFKTQILGINETFASATNAAYDPWRRQAQKLSHTYVTLEGADPIEVARQVNRILEGKSNRPRHRAGRDVSKEFMKQRFMPSWLLERSITKLHENK